MSHKTSSNRSVIDTVQSMLFFTIDLAEASMSKAQFRAFKKLLFDHFHKVVKPQLLQELGLRTGGQEPQRPGQCQTMVRKELPMILETTKF